MDQAFSYHKGVGVIMVNSQRQSLSNIASSQSFLGKSGII